jgi:hypothetical protein
MERGLGMTEYWRFLTPQILCESSIQVVDGLGKHPLNYYLEKE